MGLGVEVIKQIGAVRARQRTREKESCPALTHAMEGVALCHYQTGKGQVQLTCSAHLSPCTGDGFL